jgi:hypothetical protein
MRGFLLKGLQAGKMVLFSVTTIYKNLNALLWRLEGGGAGIQGQPGGARRWSGGGLFSNTMFYHGIFLHA